MIPSEPHPLKPFLPDGARMLMLGSFPPQRKRWSMEFYYPNLNNDMWRIFGLIFFADKEYFLTPSKRAFCRERISDFLTKRGVALYDTATVVRRLRDNASDKFLEVVEPTDVRGMIEQLPQCQAIVTTGQKATDTLCAMLSAEEPKIGEWSDVNINGRHLRFYRMPSSSRAYPLAIDKKADVYRKMMKEMGFI